MAQSSGVITIPIRAYRSSICRYHDFGHQYSYNQRVDHLVTQKGFRLWVDIAGRRYTPESPFVGFSANKSYYGVGLRDGFRFLDGRQSQYLWTFARPASGTDKPILHVEPVFYTHDGRVLSATNLSFTSWELSENADRLIPLGSPEALVAKCAFCVFTREV